MPRLDLSHIVKTHGGFRALDDLSLSVEDREFLCFLGPSGCGKTTLLRVIAGLDRQTSGSLRFDGRDLSRAAPGARDYGIVFQSYALFPNLTVAGNVAYGLAGRTAPHKIARVAEMLDLVGLPGLGGQFPAQLSGGQQQRVALARALAPAPRLLLLDEPLSALDARVRLALRGQIRALHDRLGLTTILVTHDQEEALTMADRIVVMNKGRVEQCASPQTLYAAPANRFVADFVGTMNLFDGSVGADGEIRVGALDWRCAATAGLAGRAVTVAWRPEDSLLGPSVAANPMSGPLEGLEFRGAFHRASVRVDGLARPVLADVSAGQVRELGLTVGQSLSLSLPPDRIRLLPIANR